MVALITARTPLSSARVCHHATTLPAPALEGECPCLVCTGTKKYPSCDLLYYAERASHLLECLLDIGWILH